MSKRRGKILNDSASLERRKWYSDLQAPGLAEAERVYELQRQQRCSEEEAALKAAQVESRINSLLEVGSTITTPKLVASKWVRVLNGPIERRAIVLCVHGIGQNYTIFQKWADIFAHHNVQLCSVCLPGRSDRAAEANFQSIQDSAIAIFDSLKSMGILQVKEKLEEDQEELASAINTARFKLVLFGNNLGALICFELARLLENYQYYFTCVIACGSPSAYLQGQNKFGRKYCFLSDKEILDRMKQLGGIPPYFSQRRELLRVFVSLIRSDYYLYDKYRLQQPASIEGIVPEDKLKADPAGNGRTKVDDSDRYRDDEPTNPDEEEEELIFPVAMYRLHVPVVTLRAEDDIFVSEEEISQWSFLGTTYDHISLMPETGGHFHALFDTRNLTAVMRTLLEYCGINLDDIS